MALKPNLNENNIKSLVSELFGLNCVSIRQLNGYDDLNYYIKCNSSIKNSFIDNAVNVDGYVLKIVNSVDSKSHDLLDGLNKILLHLGSKKIICPKPIRSINGNYLPKLQLDGDDHVVRLFEFISGSILVQISPANELFFEVGKYVANLDLALKDFHNESIRTREGLWRLDSVPKLIEFLYAVEDETRRKMVKDVISEFDEKIIKSSKDFEKGVIHGDFNEQNILIHMDSEKWKIKGILDFGDCHFSYYLFELAITMTYMILQARNYEAAGHVLAGYSSVCSLTEGELSSLKICIEARLCQSLVLGAYFYKKDPKNSYLLTTAALGWKTLIELREKSENDLMSPWLEIVRRWRGDNWENNQNVQ